jgi:hypothetical protein
MTHLTRLMRHLGQFISTLRLLLTDGLRYVGLCLRSPNALAAENLFSPQAVGPISGALDHPTARH